MASLRRAASVEPLATVLTAVPPVLDSIVTPIFEAA